MTFHGGVFDALQNAFPTVGSQFVATVGAVVVVALVVTLVRRAGPPLKPHFNDALVESAQAAVVAVVAFAVGGFLVVVWRATPQLLVVVDLLNLERADVVRIVFTVAILAGSYALTRVTKQAVRRLARSQGAISNHQQEIAHHLVQVGVYLLASFVVLGLWEVNVEGLLVGAGFLGLVLGLAARQTLGAVLAGFVVLFSRPFELGDWVVVDDREGIVTDITIVNTRVRTFDDEYVMIPNDVITSTEVVNRTREGRLRINQDVGVDYDADVERAMSVAESAMAELDVLLDAPEPHAVLTEFGESSIVLRLRFYIDDPSARKMWHARTEVITAVKNAFDEEGIKIPFPQRELLGREETGGLRLADVETLSDGSESSENEADGKQARTEGES